MALNFNSANFQRNNTVNGFVSIVTAEISNNKYKSKEIQLGRLLLPSSNETIK